MNDEQKKILKLVELDLGVSDEALAKSVTEKSSAELIRTYAELSMAASLNVLARLMTEAYKEASNG